jgi:ribose transport system substrate-binding protein
MGSPRRWLAIACSVTCIASLSACGSSNADAGGGDSGIKGKKVAIIGPMAGDAYYEDVACGAQKEGKKLGLDVGKQQAASSQSQAQQDAIVKSVLASRPDAIIYTPADGEAGGIPLRTAGKTIVINVDAKLADEKLYTSFVASDHQEGSVTLAKELVDQIGGSGKIAAIGVLPSNPITQARINGLKEGLKEVPDVDLVSVSYPDLSPSAIQNQASSLLAKYPDLKGFYTTNYIIADAVGTALRNAKLVGKVKMATWDTNPVNVKLLQQGVATAAVAQQPVQMGALAIQQITAKLEGKPTAKVVPSPVSIVTDETVDTPEGKKLWYEGAC